MDYIRMVVCNSLQSW